MTQVQKHKNSKTIWAMIAAAGKGSRMSSSESKQFLDLAGKSVIKRSCEAFEKARYIDQYVVVAAPNQVIAMKAELSFFAQKGKCAGVIAGGETRQASVYQGLSYLYHDLDLTDFCVVLVHDGARCLVKPQLIDQVAQKILTEHCGVAPVVPVKDTIRLLDLEGKPQLTPPRDRLVAMQTPQGASLNALYYAYDYVFHNQEEVTDDVEALLQRNYPVRFIEGDRSNIKITYPDDLALANYYLKKHDSSLK